MLSYLKYFETRDYRDREISTIKKFQKNTNVLSLDGAVDFAIKNCQEYLNNPIEIFRGITTRYDSNGGVDLNNMKNVNYFYGDPIRRFSRDNKNFYNLIIDNHKSWRGYPKRQKSFSCSLYSKYLGDQVYRVIPIDGSFWGICPNYDLFRSFYKGLEDCGTHNIDYFFRYLEGTIKLTDDTKYYQLKKDLENPIFLKKGENEYDSYGSEYIKDFIKKKTKKNNKTVFDVVVDAMNPDLNGFHKLSYKEMCEPSKWLQEITSDNLECWTESRCLFIRNTVYNSFMKSVNAREFNQIPLKIGKSIIKDIEQSDLNKVIE